MQKQRMNADHATVRFSGPYTDTQGEIQAALDDFLRGLSMWPIWTTLALQEVRRRYRRTLIGPYWTSLSYAILVGAMAVVFANLWHMKLSDYLPYLASGFIGWIFIGTIVADSCTVFITSEGLLKNSTLPYSLFVYTMLMRNLIVLLHHMSVYAIVLLIFHDALNWNILLIFPALALIVLNGVWIGFALGILVARYRDLQQIVASALQILLFITPVFWPVEGVTGHVRYFLVEPNIVYHTVSLLRLPLLGKAPTLLDWGSVVAFTIVGWTVVLYMLVRFRRYLAFWL